MLIDQSSRHFGTLLHFVRHYGIRHNGIRHSETNPIILLWTSGRNVFEGRPSTVWQPFSPIFRAGPGDEAKPVYHTLLSVFERDTPNLQAVNARGWECGCCRHTTGKRWAWEQTMLGNLRFYLAVLNWVTILALLSDPEEIYDQHRQLNTHLQSNIRRPCRQGRGCCALIAVLRHLRLKNAPLCSLVGSGEWRRPPLVGWRKFLREGKEFVGILMHCWGIQNWVINVVLRYVTSCGHYHSV